MFVYSVRASTIKFFAVLILTVALLFSIVYIGGFKTEAVATVGDVTVDYRGIKTNEERLAFIRQFIPEVSGEAKEEVSFSIPEDFDRIMRSYNEIQKSQGLDITRYKNKKVTRYTYEIERLGDYDKPVYINLIVYRGTVIACDVSSADPEGFVKPLVKFD